MKGESLLSDHGHHLLFCECGVCALERWNKDCAEWFRRQGEMPEREFRRVAGSWKWRGTTAA